MSKLINNETGLRLAKCRFWAGIFGQSIQTGQEKKGYSVENAPRRACMKPSEWLAVEAGQVAETAARLRSMTGVLGLSNAQLGTVLRLCQNAWEG